MHVRSIVALAVIAVAVACSSQSSTSGSATYDRPADAGGDPVQPQPRQEDFEVNVTLSGAADFEAVNNLACSISNGDFTLTTQSNGRIESDGRYRSEFSTEADSSANTSILNVLCGELKNLEIDSVTSLTLRASIPANETNCESYCQAYAEGQCPSSTGGCFTTAKAGCDTDCDAATRISGEGTLTSDQAAELNSRLAGGSGKVEAQVDLVFNALD